MTSNHRPDLVLHASALRRQYPAPGLRGLLGERRGGIRAFDLEVGAGERVALLGANGSGKTTALRCLAGLERADGGALQVLGRSPLEVSVRREIGFVPESSPIAPERSGRAFLEELAFASGIARRERRHLCAALLDRFGLLADADRSARGYSKGMLRRVVLAQAFLRPRRVLLLDEPTSGLDALGLLIWQELLDEESARGTAIVTSSHWSSEALESCDRALVLEGGAVLRAACTAELFLDPTVHELAVRGLAASDLEALRGAIAARGGEILRDAPQRRGLRDVLREFVRR